MKNSFPSIFTDTEKMLQYLYTIIRKIANAEKYTLGAQIRESAVLFYALIRRSYYTYNRTEKLKALNEAKLELDKLNVEIKLALAIGAMRDIKNHQKISEMLGQISEQLRAWSSHC
jgi:four helix bundle protein